MKVRSLFFLAIALTTNAFAQTTITNAGFENWGNTVPSGDSHTEPTNWYSNQSGSSIAALGGQTCFKDSTVVHSGSYSVRVETISGPLSNVINGNVTTGVVNAPTLTKTDGYIGTENFSDSTADVRRMAFTGKPDSLVGWYQYSPGGSGEMGKIRAILHKGQYYDPETPATYHANPTSNKIADLTFFTPPSAVSTWTRFSMPFTYVDTSTTPSYIMINITSSANQGTTITGSKMWVDDLKAVYRTSSTSQLTTIGIVEPIQVRAFGKSLNVLMNGVESADLALYDLTGKKVYSAHIANTSSASFNMSDLVPGIYVYHVVNSTINLTGKVFIH
jgi:hypothetical protein